MFKINGTLGITEHTDPDDKTITMLQGSNAYVSVKTNCDFIVDKNCTLTVDKDGDVFMVIVTGGSLIVKGHIKSVTIGSGKLFIHPTAKIDIINRSVQSKETIDISFVDGTDPCAYPIRTEDHTNDKTEIQKALGK